MLTFSRAGDAQRHSLRRCWRGAARRWDRPQAAEGRLGRALLVRRAGVVSASFQLLSLSYHEFNRAVTLSQAEEHLHFPRPPPRRAWAVGHYGNAAAHCSPLWASVGTYAHLQPFRHPHGHTQQQNRCLKQGITRHRLRDIALPAKN